MKNKFKDTDMEHKYNTDLLIDDQDKKHAEAYYSDIFYILCFEELNNKFVEFDTAANKAKKSCRNIGLFSVIGATLALLSAATAPLLPSSLNCIGFILECIGLLSALIAVGGVRLSHKKKNWLQSRMMAESIRLWHFQFILNHLKEIASSHNNKQAQDDFLEKRKKEFEHFFYQWNNFKESKLQQLIDEDDENKLMDENSYDFPITNPTFDNICKAYAELRFRHQLAYTNHKLQTTEKSIFSLFNSIIELNNVIEKVAIFCLFSSVVVSLGAIICFICTSMSFFDGESIGKVLSIITIVILIISVVVKTVQNALGLPSEIRNYRSYKKTIQFLSKKFDVLKDEDKLQNKKRKIEIIQREKFELMKSMEQTAFQEMKGFLKNFHETKFIV